MWGKVWFGVLPSIRCSLGFDDGLEAWREALTSLAPSIRTGDGIVPLSCCRARQGTPGGVGVGGDWFRDHDRKDSRASRAFDPGSLSGNADAGQLVRLLPCQGSFVGVLSGHPPRKRCEGPTSELKPSPRWAARSADRTVLTPLQVGFVTPPS